MPDPAAPTFADAHEPAAGLTGWAMRPDQAQALGAVIGGDIPAVPMAQRSYVLLVEAHDGVARSAGAWSVVPASEVPQLQIAARGHKILDMLDVPKAGRQASWADLRPLDERGERAAGRASCFCGSGLQARRCKHGLNPPVLYARSAVFLNDREWEGRARFDQALYGAVAEPVSKGQLRVAGALCSLSGRPFVRRVRDIDGTHPAVDVADVIVAELVQELRSRLPVLADAAVQLSSSIRESIDAPIA